MMENLCKIESVSDLPEVGDSDTIYYMECIGTSSKVKGYINISWYIGSDYCNFYVPNEDIVKLGDNILKSTNGIIPSGNTKVLAKDNYKYARDGLYKPSIERKFKDTKIQNIYEQLKEHVDMKYTDWGLLFLYNRNLYMIDDNASINLLTQFILGNCTLYIPSKKSIKYGLTYNNGVISKTFRNLPFGEDNSRGLNLEFDTWNLSRPIVPIGFDYKSNAWVSSPLLAEFDFDGLPFMINVNCDGMTQIVDPTVLIYGDYAIRHITSDYVDYDGNHLFNKPFDIIYSNLRYIRTAAYVADYDIFDERMLNILGDSVRKYNFKALDDSCAIDNIKSLNEVSKTDVPITLLFNKYSVFVDILNYYTNPICNREFILNILNTIEGIPFEVKVDKENETLPKKSYVRMKARMLRHRGDCTPLPNMKLGYSYNVSYKEHGVCKNY